EPAGGRAVRHDRGAARRPACRGRRRAPARGHTRPPFLRGPRLAGRHGVRPAPVTVAEPARQAPRGGGTGRLRRALRALSTVLIVAGTLLLADAGLTLVWQEPLSAIYAKVQQSRL